MEITLDLFKIVVKAKLIWANLLSNFSKPRYSNQTISTYLDTMNVSSTLSYKNPIKLLVAACAYNEAECIACYVLKKLGN